MKKLCCALWIFLLTLTLPALAAPGKRAFDNPRPVADSSWVKKIVTGDFNGDGKLDFATLAWETEDRCVIAGINYRRGFLVRVYRNTTPAGSRNPTFAATEQLPYTDPNDARLYPLWSSDIVAVDFDRDGKDDLVVANAHSDQVFAYRSLGSMFAAPVVTRTEDDPSYIAAGDYNADGVVDLALLHMSRNFLATEYHWKFSFVLGDRSGRFGRAVVEDLGDWSFPNNLGPFYNSSTFQFAGVPQGVKLPDGRFLDSVYMNGPMKWLSGGVIVTDGGQPMSSFRRNVWGYSLLKRGTRTPSLAEAGGRLLLGGIRRLGDTILAQDDSLLGEVYLNKDGSRGSIDQYGQAVALSDFDRDGILDLAMLSNRKAQEDPRYDSRSIFVAYGDAATTHPLSLRGYTGSLMDRFKTLDNAAGIWALGHKEGTLVSGDLNGDGYADLLTNTVGFIQVHTNVGDFAYDRPFPRILQHQGIGASNTANDYITVFGDLVVRGYKVSRAFFKRPGAMQPQAAVEGTLDETRTPPAFSFSIPPDGVLPAGDYVLSVTNGMEESQTINPPIKIRLHPLVITGVSTALPANGSATFPVTVSGWFGNDPADQRTNTVSVLDSRNPGMKTPVAVTYTDLATLRFDLAVGRPATYTVVIDNPRRSTAVSAPFAVDHTPRIDHVGWTNPDGGTGTQPPSGTTAPIKPGAEILVESSMLLAPDTVIWRLFKGTMLLASGTGMVAAHTPKDNIRSTFQIVSCPNLGDQTGVTVQLETRQGLTSNAFGPLTLDAP